MNTLGEKVTRRGFGPRARVSAASAHSSSSVEESTSAFTSSRVRSRSRSAARVARSGGSRSASAHASRHRRPPTRRAAETRRGMRRGRARERRVRTHRRRTQRRRARRERVWRADTPLAEDTRAPAHNTRNVALGSSSSRRGSVRPASSPCLSRPRGEVSAASGGNGGPFFNLDRRSDCLPVRITRPHRICAKISTLRFYWLLS